MGNQGASSLIQSTAPQLACNAKLRSCSLECLHSVAAKQQKGAQSSGSEQ